MMILSMICTLLYEETNILCEDIDVTLSLFTIFVQLKTTTEIN